MTAKTHSSPILNDGISTRRKRILLVLLAPLAVIFALSSGYSLLGQSRDYLSYEVFFYNLQPSDPTAFVRFEPGFVFLAFIAKFIFFQSLQLFLCTLLLIALLLKIRFFLSTQYPVLTMVFYIANWYPLHEYTQIRVAIATSILFWAFDQLLRGNHLRSIMICMIAASFHGSALFAAAIFALAYSLANSRLTISLPVVTATGLAIPILIKGVLLPVAQIINPLSVNYVMNADIFDPPTIMSGANILTTLFLLFFALSSGLKHQRHRIIFLTSVLSLCVFISFRDVPVFAHRLREIGLVFMTLIAFDYKIRWSTLLQAIIAIGLSIWTLYSSITDGIILGSTL